MAKTKQVDYAYKSYVLTNHKDLISQFKKAKKNDYLLSLYLSDGVVLKSSFDGISVSDIQNDCLSNDLGKVFNEIVRIERAGYNRATRLRKRIETMLLNGDCLFLTLTFNDDTLTNTNENTRRQLVVRYLKSFNCQYIANIDFGAKNGREHYHAIINTNSIDLKAWRKNGNINVQRVRNKDIEVSKTRLSKYISKLSNHAVKETTKRNAIIYSR